MFAPYTYENDMDIRICLRKRHEVSSDLFVRTSKQIMGVVMTPNFVLDDLIEARFSPD